THAEQATSVNSVSQPNLGHVCFQRFVNTDATCPLDGVLIPTCVSRALRVALSAASAAAAPMPAPLLCPLLLLGLERARLSEPGGGTPLPPALAPAVPRRLLPADPSPPPA